MNNENTNVVPLSTVFGVASVWFGAHVGGGFATGNQTRTFFVKFGYPSIFLPFIIVALIGFVFYEGILFARNNNEYNYHNWIEKLCAPYGKIMGYIFDIAYLLLTIVAVGASIAGSAALLENLFNLQYIIGVAITGVIFFLLTIFGADLVRKASTAITLLILIFLTIVTVSGLKANIGNLNIIMETKETAAPMSTVLYNGLKYAGFQSLVLAIMLGASKPLTTKKSVRQFAIIGVILNGAMITMSCLMMLAHLSLIKDETLPILTIIKQLNSTPLLYAYSITLFLAFVSTGVGCIFGIVARYENSFEQIGDITKRRMLISLVSMIISMFISLVGLNTLVVKGYGYLGILSIFFLIIPTIVLGIIKNRKY
ncbi:MAG: YkvI family membrane protein [Peptoanaerobacter stomatis]